MYRPRKVKRKAKRFVSRTFIANGGASIVTRSMVRDIRAIRVPIRMCRYTFLAAKMVDTTVLICSEKRIRGES